MSTCRNFVENQGLSDVRAQIVCWLLHWIATWCPGLNLIRSKRRDHHRVFFAVCKTASNLTSVEDNVTAFCLFAFQSIRLPKSLNIYSWELNWVCKLSAKLALLLTSQISRERPTCPSNKIVNVRVSTRYSIIFVTNSKWCGEGFVSVKEDKSMIWQDGGQDGIRIAIV